MSKSQPLPLPLSFSAPSALHIGAIAFPLLPRLEDLDRPPEPLDARYHSLSSVLNNPHANTRNEMPTLPLVIPPLTLTDSNIDTPSVRAQLLSLSAMIELYEFHHNKDSGFANIMSALDDDEHQSARAQAQLDACLSFVPRKFFDENFDEIHEVLTFLESENDNGSDNDSDNGSGGGGGDVLDDMKHPNRNPFHHVDDLIERDDDRDELFTGKHARQPAFTDMDVATSAKSPTMNQNIQSKTRSFLSYIVNALTPNIPTFTLMPLPQPTSNFLSSRRFSSLSLSAEEELKAAQLLSTLTTFLDLLEVTIASQIHLRSSSFFDSLLTINDLHLEASGIIESIVSVRREIGRIDRKLVYEPLRVTGNSVRHHRLSLLVSATESVSVIDKSLRRIDQLLEEEQFALMLELVHTTRLSLHSEPLSSIHCLRQAEARIAGMVSQASLRLRNLFTEAAIDSGITNDGGSGSVSEDEHDTLVGLTQCLYHVDGIVSAVTQYSDSLLHAVKCITDDFIDELNTDNHSHSDASTAPAVPSAQSASSASPQRERTFTAALSAILPSRNAANQPQHRSSLSSPPTSPQPQAPVTQSNLQRSLCQWSVSDMLTRFRTMHQLTMSLLQRSQTVTCTVIHAIETVPSPLFIVDKEINDRHRRLSLPPDDLSLTVTQVRHQCLTSVHSSIEWHERELGRLINQRFSLSSSLSLSLEELSKLSVAILEFVTSHQSLVTISSSPLRLSLALVCSHFVSQHHVREMSHALSRLDRELWNRVDVNKEIQSVIDSHYTTPTLAPIGTNNDTHNHGDSGTSMSNGARVIFVERVNTGTGARDFSKFPVVGSVLTLITKVSSYLHIARTVPATVMDVGTKLFELCHSFVGRMRTLILGAQSLASAGLKTITTTHIGLCCQSLAFVQSQLPVIQLQLDYLLTAATESQAVDVAIIASHKQTVSASLRLLDAELASQQRELLAKLGSIMKELAEGAAKKFLGGLHTIVPTPVFGVNTNTATTADSDSQCDAAIRTLLTQTKSLNASLSAVLSLSQRESVFASIIQSYATILMANIRRADLQRSGVEERCRGTMLSVIRSFQSLPAYDAAVWKPFAPLLHIDVAVLTAPTHAPALHSSSPSMEDQRQQSSLAAADSSPPVSGTATPAAEPNDSNAAPIADGSGIADVG